jgi:cation:H+ antiporter
MLPMSLLTWVVLQLAVCALLILVSGIRLSRYGDVLAEKTGLGGTWIGVLVMAGVTSLPELVTGASAVALFDVADIAAGDAIGSCMFNLLILAFLDARHPVPLSTRIHQGHVLSAAFGVLLLGIAAGALLAGPNAPALGWVAVHSLVFIGVYALAMRLIFYFERARIAEVVETAQEAARYDEITLRGAVVRYTAWALVLVAAAAYLPGAAERLSVLTGLEQSFVGSLLVAGSTSLPEVVVSIAAVRMGAVDMAAANLFGSNLFNVAVLGIDDLVYARGVLLADVSRAHLVTLVAAMTMTAIAIIGLTYRARRKRYRFSWDALAIVAVYVVSVLLLKRLA